MLSLGSETQNEERMSQLPHCAHEKESDRLSEWASYLFLQAVSLWKTHGYSTWLPTENLLVDCNVEIDPWVSARHWSLVVQRVAFLVPAHTPQQPIEDSLLVAPALLILCILWDAACRSGCCVDALCFRLHDPGLGVNLYQACTCVTTLHLWQQLNYLTVPTGENPREIVISFICQLWR